MINREIEDEIKILKNEFPIIAILGPRQSGKTTLSKKVFHNYEYVSLEDIDHREFAQNDPRGFLSRYSSNIIFDEIQRVPELISYLQTHADEQKENGKIVITGSHNFLLMEQISQSLAGRVGISKLLPFSLYEIRGASKNLNDFLYSGMYPRIYDQRIRPEKFYKNYISTYVEKDVRQIKKITDLDNFMKFIKILAGRTGQELNLSGISEECGISHNTVKEWISVLEASFIVYRIQPYHKNYKKRLVKNPKLYFTDTGLVCNLLGIRNRDDLDYHFLKGNIFETFVLSEFIKYNFNYGEMLQFYFWRDNHQKEIDLIIDFGTKHFGIEIKSSETLQEKYFAGLKYWEKLSGDDPSSLFLLYGGTENLVRNKMNVVSWNRIKEIIIKKAL
ncbi:MAG: ATP-binding protein [Spirochaetia bacterium]|nr:ATP-binding protein [Spirochaetia bacterium]MCF7952853.1 ATP-binding protein [Spirochaetales bacterium]